eukprot:6178507-Alexandrium_andersonii.AAC.1
MAPARYGNERGPPGDPPRRRGAVTARPGGPGPHGAPGAHHAGTRCLPSPSGPRRPDPGGC